MGIGGIGLAEARGSARLPAAPSFAAPTRLSQSGLVLGPQVYAAGSSAVLLWAQNLPHCRQRVQAAVWQEPGSFGSPRSLGSPSPALYQCATGTGQIAGAGSAGDALIAWLQGSRIDVATLIP
jgi:hypothetical protein